MPYGIGPPPEPPRRGSPGGWRDWWERDEEDETARARAARFAAETERVRAAWRREPKPTAGRAERPPDSAAPSASPATRP